MVLSDITSQPPLSAMGVSPVRQSILVHIGAESDRRTAQAVLLHSLTEAGAMIECDGPIPVGTAVFFDMAHHGLAEARVIWTGNRVANCQFLSSLSPSLMEDIEEGAEIVTRDLIDAISDAGTPCAIDHLTGHVQFNQLSTARFGQRLRQLRKQRGMTQADLAAFLGVSMPAISAWEKGRSLPRDARLETLAKALEIPLTSLVVNTPIEPLDDLLEKCRQQISQALGTTPQQVRISVEL
jgi:transcriptional regulator with XRE-family HTH domain